MSPAIPAVSFLACAASGFVLWASFAPSTTKPLATYLALVALALAFALSPQALALFSPVMGEVRPLVRLEYVAGGCFLGLMGIALLHDEMLPPQTGLDVAVTHALPLLGSCGGILALWSSNLMDLGIGIGLYAVARWPKWQGQKDAEKGMIPILSSLSILLGTALVYSETATFDMASLGRFLWQHGEPQSFGLYLGLGLVLAGISLPTGFIPPFGSFGGEGDSTVSHLLGLMVLLRLGLHLGALAWECFWVCLSLSLVCLVWGWATALAHTLGDPLGRIWGLLVAQRGFLLLPLAFIFRGQNLAPLVTVAVAYALVQGVVRLSLRWLSVIGDVAPSRLLSRTVIKRPMVGVPLCVGVLSLIGLPPTLGFIVRAELVRLAWTLQLTWLVPVVVTMSILCLWAFIPLVLPLLGGTGGRADLPPPWPVRIALVLAAISLVALGLFPLPLLQLADWLLGV